MLRRTIAFLAGLFSGGALMGRSGMHSASPPPIPITALSPQILRDCTVRNAGGGGFFGRTLGTRKAMREARKRRRFNARISKRG